MKRFMFALVVLLAVVSYNTAFSQAVTQASCIVSVDVSGTPLTIESGGDLTVVGVTVGSAIALVPDGADAFVDPGNSTYASNVIGSSTPGIFDVSGDPNAKVIMSCALPTVLYGDGLQGEVDVTYNGTSACWVDAGSGEIHYFNPLLPVTFYMAGDGSATHINLGGIFTVAPNSAAGVYQADAIVTVAYAAN